MILFSRLVLCRAQGTRASVPLNMRNASNLKSGYTSKHRPRVLSFVTLVPYAPLSYEGVEPNARYKKAQ